MYQISLEAIAFILSVFGITNTYYIQRKETLIRDVQNNIAECRRLNNFDEQNGEEILEDRIMCYDSETNLHRFSLIKLKILNKKIEKFKDDLVEVL